MKTVALLLAAWSIMCLLGSRDAYAPAAPARAVQETHDEEVRVYPAVEWI